MVNQSELLVEELVRTFGRPAPSDPARTRLLDELASRSLLAAEYRVLALLPHPDLIGALLCRCTTLTVVEPLDPFLERLRQQFSTLERPVHWIRRDPKRIGFRHAFDLIVSLSGVLGTTGDVGDDRIVLQQLATALRPGGTLVLELPNRESLVRQFVERDWAEFDAVRVLLRQRWELLTGTLRLEWRILWGSGSESAHERSLRLYSGPELVMLCREAGFEVLECWGNDDASPYSLWSPRLILLARTPSGPQEPIVVGGTE